MEKLNLTFLRHPIKVQSDEDTVQQIHDMLDGVGKIYSFILYAKYNESELLEGYDINYRICDVSKFNTIDIDDVVNLVVKFIKNPKGRFVVGYKQPSLDILIITFDNLIYKLALVQSLRWKRLEFDDLYQMCRLTLCNLYSKGYYIHKSLLAKSFENDVLMEIRKLQYEPNFVSLDDRVESPDDNLTVKDTIRDTYEETRQYDEDETLIQLCIFEEVRKIVIDMIGQRGFDQLCREYRSKNTTSWSRKVMYDVRKKFESEGLTRKEFLRKYGR